jgi:hypothetical protein
VWAPALAEHVFHGLSFSGVAAISLNSLLLQPFGHILKSIER